MFTIILKLRTANFRNFAIMSFGKTRVLSPSAQTQIELSLTQHQSTTAEVMAGEYRSLWKLGRKMNKMALSWKFMEDMVKEGMGVNEVEAESWIRSYGRAVKKGQDISGLKRLEYDGRMERDGKYVVKIMRIRADHAKEDWIEVRSKFHAFRAKLFREAKENQETKKSIRWEISQIENENEKWYIKERLNHKEKILGMKEELKQRLCVNAEIVKRQEINEVMDK